MSHQPINMPDDMAIDLWLQSLNDELNEALARDGRDDLTDLLQQRYSILKKLAIASVKREPLADVPDSVLASALEQAAAETDDWAATQFFEPSGEQQSVRCFRRMLELASAPPVTATTASREES